MTDLRRVDLISLFDVDFKKSKLTPKDLSRIERVADREGELLGNLSHSYSWVFQWNVGNEIALPGMARYGLTKFAKKCGLKDASLLVSPQLGVGVLCMQHETAGIDSFATAIDSKRENYQAWDAAKQLLGILGTIGLAFNETERSYPIVGIQVRDTTLDVLLSNRDQRLQVAKLFTGDYEHERDESLLAYIESNDLSRRSFERLYVRWTDMLVIYDDRVGEDYNGAFFRCVLIYETCVLMRRMLRSAIERMDRIYLTMSIVPRPFAVERLTSSVAWLRSEFIMLPPVQSVEAQRLLASAYEKFGIYELSNATAGRSELLESRYQWAKALTLAALAVLTYLLDKFDFFSWIKCIATQLLLRASHTF
jgi:hypothetical protein